MDRQTFNAFMASVGASPQDFHAALADARRRGHARFDDYLAAKASDGEPATYVTRHLMAFWDDQSRLHLADVLVGWLETPDFAGDAASKWEILQRRLGYPVKLADLIERFSDPTGRGVVFDARLENALAHLRSARGHKGAHFLNPVVKMLYASTVVRALSR